MNASDSTRNHFDAFAAVIEARKAWHAARPVDAMNLLARAGIDTKGRRKHLIRWGVSADDAIDFSANSYIAEPCSYTGCRGHYLALGLTEPVWCADHADLAEAVRCGHSRCAYEGSCQLFGNETGSASLALVFLVLPVLLVILPMLVSALHGLNTAAVTL